MTNKPNSAEVLVKEILGMYYHQDAFKYNWDEYPDDKIVKDFKKIQEAITQHTAEKDARIKELEGVVTTLARTLLSREIGMVNGIDIKALEETGGE